MTKEVTTKMEKVMRVSRFVIYEGTPEWIEKTLAKSMLKLGEEFQAGDGNTIHIENEMRSVHEREVTVVAEKEKAHGA